MEKNVIKMAVAAVCVVVAGMGGMNAYNAANQSEANSLLEENVEALSAGDNGTSYICAGPGQCFVPGHGEGSHAMIY